MVSATLNSAARLAPEPAENIAVLDGIAAAETIMPAAPRDAR